MTEIFRGHLDDIGQDIQKNDIRYGVSIGRRAPLHVMHVDCLREIADAGLTPIIVIGSPNGADSSLYDPVRNPFTVEQQKEQMRLAMPDLYDEKLVIVLHDMARTDRWLKNLQKKVMAITGGKKAAIHFRSKEEDAATAKQKIKSLSHYEQGYIDQGFSIWQSYNRDPAHNNIHASDIRRFDLERLTPEQRNLISAPDYVIGLVKAARASNPDKGLLEKNKVPLTVFDLALERLWREAGISTAAVFAAAGQEITLDTLAAAANKLVKESREALAKKPRSVTPQFSVAARMAKKAQSESLRATAARAGAKCALRQQKL